VTAVHLVFGIVLWFAEPLGIAWCQAHPAARRRGVRCTARMLAPWWAANAVVALAVNAAILSLVLGETGPRGTSPTITGCCGTAASLVTALAVWRRTRRPRGAAGYESCQPRAAPGSRTWHAACGTALSPARPGSRSRPARPPFPAGGGRRG
jgi:hypothetical protein